LTGCATKGYHNAPAGVGVSPRLLTLSERSFVWPVRGSSVALGYGASEDGASLKGVVLQGRNGDAVVAARDGKVIFADEKFQGYGKTLILEHADGFSTVYARSSEVLVRPGERVLQGQPVARLGAGGKGGVPRLYFEIRRHGKAEDPARYLH
jgi:septal ring factor EnvC (AmiA/AmiB activator)